MTRPHADTRIIYGAPLNMDGNWKEGRGDAGWKGTERILEELGGSSLVY